MNVSKKSIPSFKDAFYEKFPKYRKAVVYYEEANGCECKWESFTKSRLQRFVNHMYCRISPNSVKCYASKFRAVMLLYSDVIKIPKDFSKILNCRKDASQQVFLTSSEIKKIIEYVPRSRSEHIVRNQFVIGCLTGARHGDYVCFGRSNISGKFIRYVSAKTHIETTIPMSPAVRRIIDENERMGFVGVKLCDVYFNDIVRRICFNVGITENVTIYRRGKYSTGMKCTFVSSHTARRSFATNLYVNGVDIYSISKLCGHSSIEMTKSYICCEPKITSSAIKFLNGFN